MLFDLEPTVWFEKAPKVWDPFFVYVEALRFTFYFIFFFYLGGFKIIYWTLLQFCIVFFAVAFYD